VPSAGRVKRGRAPGLANFRRRALSNRVTIVALCILGLLVLLAVFSPFITPYDPYQQDLRNVTRPPFTDGHLLGTDALGRDVLSRVMVGSRTSMLAVLEGLTVAFLLGVPLGFVAGFFGGLIDVVIMRVTDAVMSFPGMILAIALVGMLGPSLRNAMIAVGFLMSPRFLRLIRGVVLGITQETYVEAARSIGAGSLRIILRHIVPNALSPLTVALSVTAGFVMLSEAGLSFLGLGVQPPNTSWGAMIQDGFQIFLRAPWLGVVPGILISISVFTFILLGDGLRDSLGREERRE
jgi:peptide/nickel transport system permease protein